MTVSTLKSKTKSKSRSRRGRRQSQKNNNNNNSSIEHSTHTPMQIDSQLTVTDNDSEIDDVTMASPSPSHSISTISPMNNDPQNSYFSFTHLASMNDTNDSSQESIDDRNDSEQMRGFIFNIENDENLQSIIANNLNDTAMAIIDSPPIHTRMDMFGIDNINEMTSDYILSKLYNYMKISEMSKYGISVFEMTFSSYLPYLYESDLVKLAASYWCNGPHFNCMVSHRGESIKAHNKLKLKITNDLLDTAMQSGASVDKIEAMLLQKRVDEGIQSNKDAHTKNIVFYHTKSERHFYLRNLKHRFWNHEVLVRVFVSNNWLTPALANIALQTFVKTVYSRVLQSKSFGNAQSNNRSLNGSRGQNNGIQFSENFLHSFFVSYFCLDNIPKMYKKEISQKMSANGSVTSESCVNQISQETLRRWCELVELLASRGGNVRECEFRKVIPLQYALNLGKNTFKIISSNHRTKNEILIPQTFYQSNIYINDDVWNELVSYL